MALMVPREYRELPERRVPKASREFKELLGLKAFKVPKVGLATKYVYVTNIPCNYFCFLFCFVFSNNKAMQEREEKMERMESMERTGLLALLGRQVLRHFKKNHFHAACCI
jgi:hypothetical protein